MKLLAPLLLQLIIFSLSAQHHPNVIIENESTFSIHGRSNVNTFSCELNQHFSSTPIKATYTALENKLSFDSTFIHLNIFNFDCHNQKMTNDLRATLQAQDFPFITIELLTLQLIPLSQEVTCHSTAKVKISLAGVDKEYLLNYEAKKMGGEKIMTKIKAQFNMKDFELTPPSLFMGLVKVDELITINLDLILSIE